MAAFKLPGLVALAYLMTFLLVVPFYLIDLFAKAYDTAAVFRYTAIGIHCALTASYCCFMAWITWEIVKHSSLIARLCFGLLLAPAEFLFVVRGLEMVDWMPVYVSALALPIVLGLKALRSHSTPAFVWCTALIGGIAFVGWRSTNASFRLERYSAMLREGDWVCDEKTRAVVELCDLGITGEESIVSYGLTTQGEDRRLLIAHLPKTNTVADDVRQKLSATQ